MIIREHPSALYLFLVVQGSVLPRILGKIIAAALLTALVLITDATLWKLPHISIGAMSVFGVALSLFLGFRNNAAYARWWEARGFWGAIIAQIRSLGQQMIAFNDSPDDRRKILSYAVAFAHLHRGFLRGVDAAPQITAALPPEAAAPLTAAANPAHAALRAMAACINDMHKNGRIDDFGRLALSQSLTDLAGSQAGCEKIRTTPLPFVYSLLVRRTTYLYCILLPFALIDTTGWFAPLFVAVVAYVFFGLQAVTNELEHPFSHVQNGLPLDTMCRTIEISVAETLGQTPPPPLTPVNHLLT
ncbi:MAG: bestrophin family protein [Sulfitobacter sp.]